MLEREETIKAERWCSRQDREAQCTQKTNDNTVWTKSGEYKSEKRVRKENQFIEEAWQSIKLRSSNFLNKPWTTIKGF